MPKHHEAKNETASVCRCDLGHGHFVCGTVLLNTRRLITVVSALVFKCFGMAVCWTLLRSDLCTVLRPFPVVPSIDACPHLPSAPPCPPPHRTPG